MTNEVMINAMDNLLDKRANTDEFNKMYYRGEETDKTLNTIERFERIVSIRNLSFVIKRLR